MKYGIRKEDKGSKSKWKTTMENEVESLKNQITMLNGQLLHYSNRLIRLEKTNALKEVQSRAKISAIQYHKNAKRHEFTPKLFGSFSHDTQGVNSQHDQSFHLGDGSFEKKSTNSKHLSAGVYGHNLSSEANITPKINVNIFPKQGEESPSVTRYQNSKQEAMLAQVLTQLCKMDNKITDISDHVTSLDYQLSEISPRLSVMDSRLSAVDMFITMQRFDQKWKGLEPKLESLNATERIAFEVCEVEVNSDCNKAQFELKHPDERCSPPLIDNSFPNAEELLETNGKDSSLVTKTTGDEIKLVVNNSNSTSSYTSTPVLNNKLDNCRVDFKEEEMKPFSNLNSQGLNNQLPKNSISTSINSGEEIFGNCLDKANIKEKNNNSNNESNDIEQVNNKLGKCTVDFKKEEIMSSSIISGAEAPISSLPMKIMAVNKAIKPPNPEIKHTNPAFKQKLMMFENVGSCVEKFETKENNNANNENNGSQQSNQTNQPSNQTYQSSIQKEIDDVQVEQRKGEIKAKGSGGLDIQILPSLQAINNKSDFKADSLPGIEDSEDEFVIVSNLDIQEITQAETKLNSDPLKMYHDITEYLEINMGKKKNEVYEFGFEAKDDSFLKFKDNMVINDSKSIKQSSPTLQNQIPAIPIPSIQISGESKINKTSEEI